MSEAVTEEVEMDELFRKMRKMNSPDYLQRVAWNEL